MIRRITLLLGVVLALLGCKGGTKALLPSVSGKAGEVIVVMQKADWEGELGETTRNILGGECPYLAQREPLFTLVNITPSNFGDLFKVHRNVLYFNVNPQNDTIGLLHKSDVWSSPQCVLQLSAYDTEGAVEIFEQESSRIIRYLDQAERDRVVRNTMLYEERSIALRISELFEGTMHFPKGYKIRKASKDFIWVADDKQYVYQDVLIYRYPVNSDHPFTVEEMVNNRNAILMANVPGMFENTYMTTSSYFNPQLAYLRYQGRSFTQLRGMWEVQNDYMGGPFVSHSFYSPDGKDIIVLDAFVYAPRFDKRQYLRQVESLLYSWEWNKSE